MEVGDAVEEVGGAAGGFGVATVELVGLEVAREVGAAGEMDVMVADGDQGVGGAGQVVGDGQAGVKGRSGADLRELLLDVGPGDPGREAVERDVEVLSDVGEGLVGVGESLEDVRGGEEVLGPSS